VDVIDARQGLSVSGGSLEVDVLPSVGGDLLCVDAQALGGGGLFGVAQVMKPEGLGDLERLGRVRLGQERLSLSTSLAGSAAGQQDRFDARVESWVSCDVVRMVTFLRRACSRSTACTRVASAPDARRVRDGSFRATLPLAAPGGSWLRMLRSCPPVSPSQLEGGISKASACRSRGIRGRRNVVLVASGVSTSRSSTRGCRGSRRELRPTRPFASTSCRRSAALAPMRNIIDGGMAAAIREPVILRRTLTSTGTCVV